MKKRIKSFNGELDGIYEFANLDTIWKRYPFMEENIRPMVDGMDIMAMDESMYQYGGALAAQQDNGSPVIFLPMEREDWMVVTGIIHEGIHGCQIKSGRLSETSEKNVVSWDGNLVKTMDFSKGQEALSSDPKLVMEYLNLPWEREAWIVTAEYGRYLQEEGITHKFMERDFMNTLSQIYRKDLGDLVEEAIKVFCHYRHGD